MSFDSNTFLQQIGSEKAVELLRQMLRIRRFEEKSAELYSESKIRGFLHLYIGEEAVAAGVIPLLRAEDALIATYREHGHALLRGIPSTAIMAEMFGKAEGCSKGRGGSMHLYDATRRFYGGNAIVGGSLPLAVGLALADKMQNRKNISACFFGEGAMAEGIFHESMNLAALWSLPVLFCCENNLYAMGTALERSESETDLCLKVRSYRVGCESVDGMDVLAVAEVAERAIKIVREEVRPYFIEFQTYRFRAHSMFDPELYRDKIEVEAWKQRDPILAFIQQLKKQGWVKDSQIDSMEKEIAKEISDAIAFAEAGTLESPEENFKGVYTS